MGLNQALPAGQQPAQGQNNQMLQDPMAQQQQMNMGQQLPKQPAAP